MERVAFRPLRSANPSTLLIASFAVSYGLQNLAILIEGSAPQGTSVSTWLSESVQIGSVSIPKLDVVTIGVTLVLLVALGLFLQRTRMGVQMRAAAEDFQMARILGVKANTVIATAFAMSGLLAGIGAYLLVAQTGEVAPDIGNNPVLYRVRRDGPRRHGQSARGCAGGLRVRSDLRAGSRRISRSSCAPTAMRSRSPR